jgi:hypothetical protein
LQKKASIAGEIFLSARAQPSPPHQAGEQRSADQARIRVIAATGIEADDDLQGLALIEGARIVGAFSLRLSGEVPSSPREGPSA